LIMQDKNGDQGINLVRERAGLDPLSNATMKDLKRERRSEFAGEFANRHRDLVRWGDADSIYEMPLHGRAYENKTNHDSDYEVIQVWQARKNFDPEINDVWPIPTRWVRASGIEQNEGY